MAYDKISTAGVQVWMDDLSATDSVKASIQKMLEEKQITSYFTVSSYKEYDFAKELLQQFQSDKYLFSLIAILIITVACCNIISLMVLLVNDKKKEIGILMSMGASKKHIALIFALCGIIMGTLGCLLGCLTAFFTLKHIDVIVKLLSIMQGHNAFSEAFFGSKLPDAMSLSAMTFVLIITPILALLAGLIPAIKACSLKPSSILRSE
jgi:lipoprotein-releasing system permease protein